MTSWKHARSLLLSGTHRREPSSGWRIEPIPTTGEIRSLRRRRVLRNGGRAGLSEVPEGTKSFALICHDPDAPLVKPGAYGFVHWVLYGIPGDARELAEGFAGGISGSNDFGNVGYGGPMPPGGHGTHHYFFWLLALDAEPELPAGLEMWQLLNQIEPNVIGMNRLMGTYSRT